MRYLLTIIFLFAISFSIISQKKWSFGVEITPGISKILFGESQSILTVIPGVSITADFSASFSGKLTLTRKFK